MWDNIEMKIALILIIIAWCVIWGWILFKYGDCPQCGNDCKKETRLCFNGEDDEY